MPFEEPPRQELALNWAGREERLEHRVFDAERERWPFADGEFDLVLCCEVIEHLSYSPAICCGKRTACCGTEERCWLRLPTPSLRESSREC